MMAVTFGGKNNKSNFEEIFLIKLVINIALRLHLE